MPTGNPRPQGGYRKIFFAEGLDESQNINRLTGLQIAENVVYRPFQSVSKRCGTSYFGAVGGAVGIKSGVRWYRGLPTPLTRFMVVQAGDALSYANDATGAFTAIGNLAAGSTAAFFATANDPAESGVAATPASDILIIAYGSGPPMKWDGANLTQLSTTIPNAFSGTCYWHDHVWFWGDPANPYSLFATDLLNPEGFTFMNSFTPPGYRIARGDGDPTIQACVPFGDVMLVFKTNSIYEVSGYDFQGEVAFNIKPLITDIGTTAPHSIATNGSVLYFWSGSQFYKMQRGGFPQEIGTRLLQSMAAGAQGSQSVIRSVAGNFIAQRLGGYTTYTNMFFCALDLSASGVADTILVFDDDASTRANAPMWSQFKGLDVGAFVKWNGPGDQKRLYIGSATTPKVRLFGGSPTADSDYVNGASTLVPIQVRVKTGRYDFETPDQNKHLDRSYLEVEANLTSFSVEADSDVATGAQSAQSQGVVGAGGSTVGTAVVGVDKLGETTVPQYQSPIIEFEANVKGNNFTFTVLEASTTSAWSLQAINSHVLEESFPR